MKRSGLTILLTAAVLAGCQSGGSQGQPVVLSPDTHTLPFVGNVYVTEAAGDFYKTATATISQEESCLLSWKDASTVLSMYFRTSVSGSFRLCVQAKNVEGVKSNKLEFTCGSEKRSITVNDTANTIYEVGTFTVDKPGYVKIDIRSKSVNPSGSEFARIDKFYLSGEALAGECNYVTEEHVEDNYWYRRGPSVHFAYTLPEEDIEWFYNEVTVPEGADIPSTYYMLTGFSQGYMGIQTHTDSENSVLFSVWSPFKTDDPSSIPDEMRVKTLRRGEGVTAQDFGGEGSGGQSFMDWPWKPGQTYKTLVHAHPNGDNTTDFTGYFCDENGQWHLLASFRRPDTDTWYKGAHSFLECFQPETSIYTREVQFRNQWARTKEGKWVEITHAKFTCDNTGRLGMRADMYGYSEGDRFILRNCGFFDEKGTYGDFFDRQPCGTEPVIDFDYLEKL